MVGYSFPVERTVVKSYYYLSVYSFKKGMQVFDSARCFFQYQLFTMLHSQLCKPLDVKSR